jgi:hypothetical protein
MAGEKCLLSDKGNRVLSIGQRNRVCGGDTDKMLENITPTRLATKKTAKKRSSGNEH